MFYFRCLTLLAAFLLLTPKTFVSVATEPDGRKGFMQQERNSVVSAPGVSSRPGTLYTHGRRPYNRSKSRVESVFSLEAQSSKSKMAGIPVLDERLGEHQKVSKLKVPGTGPSDRPKLFYPPETTSAGHIEKATSLHLTRNTKEGQNDNTNNTDRHQMTSNVTEEIVDKGHKYQGLCRVHKESKVCYQHGASVCRCNGDLADCSGKPHVPNLSYVPKLPQDMKCLKFVYNSVKHLDDSYFANVSSFIVVDFSSNTLITISDQTFARFTNLKYLILNNNNAIGYKYLNPVFKYPPSLRLDLMSLDLGEVPTDYFYHYWNIPTSQIFMDYNFIPKLDLREFSKLDRLEYLSLTNCSIQKVVTGRMSRLHVLNLNNNNISVFPVTCNNSLYNSVNQQMLQNLSSSQRTVHQMKIMESSQGNVSLFPRLKVLDIGSNYLLGLPPPDQICLPNLRNVYLASNNITEIPESAFAGLRSLKVIYLNKMAPSITKIGARAFSIPSLTNLYLSRNKIKFSSQTISPELFQGCSRLETLSIGGNFLGDISDAKFQEMLSHTPSLKYLWSGTTEMRNIPVKAFSQLVNLERLYIYVNAIEEIPPGAFDNMPSLQYLEMDQNHISTIKENAFSLKTRNQLKEINLSKNDYLCDCNLLWFQSWMREAGSKLFADYNSYLCSDIYNVTVQKFVLSRQACLFTRQVYILFVVCLSILMLVFIVFAVVYRYRWNIRLMLYERRAPARVANLPAGVDRFLYDLFVVYSSDDSVWVEKLIRVIEKQWGLRMCIHQRDFVPGGYIIDNIIQSMNASKRILVVVSSRFAISRWCNVELQLCQSHMITHDLPSLLVVILDKIESRDMSSALMALYNTTCFLEWPSSLSDPREKAMFWTRLRKSLAPLIEERSQTTSAKRVVSRHVCDQVV